MKYEFKVKLSYGANDSTEEKITTFAESDIEAYLKVLRTLKKLEFSEILSIEILTIK